MEVIVKADISYTDKGDPGEWGVQAQFETDLSHSEDIYVLSRAILAEEFKRLSRGRKLTSISIKNIELWSVKGVTQNSLLS